MLQRVARRARRTFESLFVLKARKRTKRKRIEEEDLNRTRRKEHTLQQKSSTFDARTRTLRVLVLAWCLRTVRRSNFCRYRVRPNITSVIRLRFAVGLLCGRRWGVEKPQPCFGLPVNLPMRSSCFVLDNVVTPVIPTGFAGGPLKKDFGRWKNLELDVSMRSKVSISIFTFASFNSALHCAKLFGSLSFAVV